MPSTKRKDEIPVEHEPGTVLLELHEEICGSINDLVVFIDRTGTVIDVNPRVENLVGYSQEEVIGRNVLKLGVLSSREIPRIAKLITDAVTKGKESPLITLELIRKDGTTVPVEASNHLVRKGGSIIGAVGILRDITERKHTEEELEHHRDHLQNLVDERVAELQAKTVELEREVTERKKAEEELRVSEERFRALFERSPDAIYLHDLKGVFIDGNEAAERLVGYKKEELIGKSFLTLNLITKKTIKDAIKVLADLARTGEATDALPVTLARKDGSMAEVEVKGFPLTIDGRSVCMGIARDISERKRTEAALAESESKTRAILDAMPDLMFQVHKDGTFISYKGGSDDLYATPEEFLGKKVNDILPRDLARLTTRHMKQCLETGELQVYEYKLTVGGDEREFEARMATSGKDTVLIMIRNITARKKAEQAIKASEEKYRTLVETSTDAVLLETLNGNIIDCNVTACEMFGYSKVELRGMNAIDLVPDDVAGTLPRTIRKQLKKEGLFIGSSGRRKDGTEFPTEVSFRVASVGGQRLVHAYVRDITERTRSEKALRESEERYRAIFDQAADSIVLIDTGSKTFTEFNERAHKNLGYSREEFAQLTLADIEVIESPEETTEHIKKITKEGGDLFETKHRTKDGRTRVIMVSTRPIQAGGKTFIQGIWRDITEHKRAEEQLVRQEAFSRSLHESMKDGLLLVDLDGMTTYVNPAFCSMTGFSEKELVGIKPPFPFWNEGTRDRAMALFKRYVFEERGGEGEFEGALRRKDGDLIHCLITPAPIKGADAATSGWLAVFKDITERKRSEEEMRRRLMRYSLEDGQLYLAQEQAAGLALEAFSDLLKAGFPGLVISRAPEKEFKKDLDAEYTFHWLTDRAGAGSIAPRAAQVENCIEELQRAHTVLIDRLDFLVLKIGFSETLSLVERLREVAYLKGHIIIVSVDPTTMDPRELRLLEKECLEINPMIKVSLPEDLLEVLRYVYQRNLLGLKPSNTEIGAELGISQPTVRKRVRNLVSAGHLLQHEKGRSKVVELSERGRHLFVDGRV
ncbi:MAG: PAS domain S-box protein [Candidatus Undinarchaeales archaeon]|jgi:PAS domain S-box-containing protein|nr:PAS domain S-box protein [Candidatus Undinarchaeales archaeon]MDP7493928.1 PAS domain S-box protein [Candidatus Undinarchaeales archaeon]